MTYALLFIASLHSLVAATSSSNATLLLHEAFEATTSLEHCKENAPIRKTLPEDEAFAFETVFGTSRMEKLLEIEKDPVAYWKEREAALNEEAIPHVEFCKEYAKEAQAYIKEKSSKSDYHPWFCQDQNAIKDAIKLKISEDHPAFPTALALYTALACDHLEYPYALIAKTIKTKNMLLQDLDKLLEKEGLSEEFNQKQIWVIRKNALFSIFDDLIAMRSGKYLCAAPPAHQRMISLKAHYDDLGSPAFWGFHGSISHDSLNHALRRLLIQHFASHYGVSYQEHFNLCWDKTTLIKGNIILLAQQSIGCFYHSHELPSVRGSWRRHNLLTLLYPYPSGLTDKGFLQVTPYFVKEDPHLNWHTTPITPYHQESFKTHSSMMRWAKTHCGSENEAHYAVSRLRHTDDAPLSPREKFFKKVKESLSKGDMLYDQDWFRHPITPFGEIEEEDEWTQIMEEDEWTQIMEEDEWTQIMIRQMSYGDRTRIERVIHNKRSGVIRTTLEEIV